MKLQVHNRKLKCFLGNILSEIVFLNELVIALGIRSIHMSWQPAFLAFLNAKHNLVFSLINIHFIVTNRFPMRVKALSFSLSLFNNISVCMLKLQSNTEKEETLRNTELFSSFNVLPICSLSLYYNDILHPL